MLSIILLLSDCDNVPTLKDIFLFCTGYDNISLLGFGDEKNFFQTDDLKLPIVSTHSQTMPFPLNFPEKLDVFQKKTDEVVFESQGFFGQV